MFKVNHKKIVACALAGVLSFGIAGMTMTSVTEAAHHAEAAFEDGTHNEYSHRLKEENRVHNQNVRALKYQHKKGELSDKEFDKKMKQEQKRHDKVVSEVKADYDRHARRAHH